MGSYTPPSISTLREILKTSSRPALKLLSAPNTSVSLSYDQLQQLIDSLLNSIDQLGVSSSATVSFAFPNSASFIALFLALTFRGNLANPLNPGYTEEEFKFYLDDVSADYVVVPRGEGESVRKAAQSLQLTVLELEESINEDGVLLNMQSQDSSRAEEAGVIPEPKRNALFLHTSGTTSRPKGVPLTHHNLVTSIRNIAKTYELCENDATLLVMPLFHVHGLMAATLTTLATGGCVGIPPSGKFSASQFWPSILHMSATWYTAVPTIHQILLMRADKDYPTKNPPSLRFIRSCSASLAAPVLEKLEKTFKSPVLEAYAMTEASHQMTSNPLPKFGDRKPGSVGPGQNVKVAILDGTNKLLPWGKQGEVCIQGENVMTAYRTREDSGDINEKAFAGGWFHTGDQGILDEDNYLTLTGRIKELINRGGEKISPLEVDAALLAHPSIGEAVSFAVPNEKYGEEVNAAVVLKHGADLSQDELRAFLFQKIASFKAPKRFFFAQDLPRTATGKIQRRRVAEHFLEGN